MVLEDIELDLFTASRIGSFKHIKYYSNKERNTKKNIENLQDIKTLDSGDGVTCLVWGNKEETEILIGRKNQQIQCYNTLNKTFIDNIDVDYGKGDIVGLGKCNNQLISALSNGVIRLWNKKNKEDYDINTGGELDKMRLSPDDDSLFVTGGNENDVKLWRIGEDKPLFHAKNLPQDFLQLRQPVWVSDCCVMPGSEGKLLAACSRYGYVRLYDTRAQRRSVCNVVFEKMAASCVTPSFNERMLLVGFGRGQMHQVDLRQRGHPDKGFKGSIGAITDISLVKGTRYIASTSLDRHLKIHHGVTKELVYKQYLTSKLTAVLVQTEASTPLAIKIEDEQETAREETSNDRDDGSDGLDDLFDSMETVGTESKKRKSDEEKDMDESIKQLLRSTEKKKRKIVKEKKKKKAKSVFHNA